MKALSVSTDAYVKLDAQDRLSLSQTRGTRKLFNRIKFQSSILCNEVGSDSGLSLNIVNFKPVSMKAKQRKKHNTFLWVNRDDGKKAQKADWQLFFPSGCPDRDFLLLFFYWNTETSVCSVEFFLTRGYKIIRRVLEWSIYESISTTFTDIFINNRIELLSRPFFLIYVCGNCVLSSLLTINIWLFRFDFTSNQFTNIFQNLSFIRFEKRIFHRDQSIEGSAHRWLSVAIVSLLSIHRQHHRQFQCKTKNGTTAICMTTMTMTLMVLMDESAETVAATAAITLVMN